MKPVEEREKDKNKWRDYFGEPHAPRNDSTEGSVYYFNDAEWDRVVSIADDPELPSDETEGWRRLKLWQIGECLSSGGELSGNASRWVGRALQNIALGEDAKRALGLQGASGPRTKILRMRAWAAEMTWLTKQGRTQDEAALIVAENSGVADHNAVKSVHNDLKNRRGIFKRVQKVVVSDGDTPHVVLRSDFEEFVWGARSG